MQGTLFNYPEYVEVDGKRYKINTDYRVAIQCNQISMQDIDNTEKVMAILFLLFGEEAMRDVEHYEQLIDKASYYLNCGKENEEATEEPDMDLVEDFPYIVTSFKSDYNRDITKEEIHWWDFYYMLFGLSQSEFGNNCILNRIRDLRNLDLNKISDPKDKEKLRKAKEKFALKTKHKKQRTYSDEEIKNMEAYHKLIGK